MTRSLPIAYRFLLLTFIALSGMGSAAAATQGAATAGAPPSISHLNNPTGHYTQDADGTVHARLYLAPVGLSPDPTQDTWHFSTLSLSPITGTDAISVTGLPFGMAIHQGSPIVDLTAEDGTNLHLGVQTLGTSLQPSPPVVSSASAITYTASISGGVTAPVSMVALQPGFGGVGVRIVLANAASVPAVLTLSSDSAQKVTATQSADGSIVVSHPQQVCGQQGCHTLTAPAFNILPPILEQSAVVTATTAVTPTTLSLSTTGGASSITLDVDAAALAQAGIHFPVTLDVPVETAETRAESGTFASVSSCSPAITVPTASVVVGTVGNCSDRAVLYFNVQQLMYLEQFPITAATLHLDTPNATGATGTTMYANAPGMMLPPPPQPAPPPTTFPAPANPPNTSVPRIPQPPAIQSHPQLTWSTAPALESNAVGVQATTDSGRWHSWDVTTEVQNWAAHGQTNSGLTLEGSGPLIQFASPFDPGNLDLSSTPYLDVTLTSPQATQVGVSPSNVPVCTSNCSYTDGSLYPVGLNGENQPTPSGVAGQSTNLMQLAEYMNANLYRFDAEVNTGTSTAPIYSTNFPCNDSYNSSYEWQGAYFQMEAAYAKHLIPVVVFQQNPNGCFDGNGNETTDWNDVLQYFSYFMPNFGTVCIAIGPCSTNPPMYFEIGNEPDVPVGSEYASKWESIYPHDFENGSQGLYVWLSNTAIHPAYSNVHILTAGMDAPDTGFCDIQNVTYMQISLYDASNYGLFPVPQQILGTSVHPYGYMTNEQEPGYWKNYGYFAVNTTCTNLQDMIFQWQDAMNAVLTTQSQSPLIISEANFTGTDCISPYDTLEHEGAYQIDLYSWLYDHLGYTNWNKYPVRTIWFEEMDDVSTTGCTGLTTPEYFGLYGSGTGIGTTVNYKTLVTPYYYSLFNFVTFTCPNVFGSSTTWSEDLDTLFEILSFEPCY